MGRPQSTTTRAASGSSQKLNSAEGVRFPWWCATHDHNFGDRIEDAPLLLDRHGDVGQGPDRAQDDVAVRREVRLDQPVDGMLRLERGTVRGGRKIEEIPVDPPGHAALDLGPGDGTIQASKNWDLRPPDPVEHAEGVLRRVIDRGVAVDRRRTHEFEVV
jgi:hypothetical protein